MFSLLKLLGVPDATMHMVKGDACRNKGYYPLAIWHYNNEIRCIPNSFDGYYSRGDCYAALGKTVQAQLSYACAYLSEEKTSNEFSLQDTTKLFTSKTINHLRKAIVAAASNQDFKTIFALANHLTKLPVDEKNQRTIIYGVEIYSIIAETHINYFKNENIEWLAKLFNKAEEIARSEKTTHHESFILGSMYRVLMTLHEKYIRITTIKAHEFLAKKHYLHAISAFLSVLLVKYNDTTLQALRTAYTSLINQCLRTGNLANAIRYTELQQHDLATISANQKRQTKKQSASVKYLPTDSKDAARTNEITINPPRPQAPPSASTVDNSKPFEQPKKNKKAKIPSEAAEKKNKRVDWEISSNTDKREEIKAAPDEKKQHKDKRPNPNAALSAIIVAQKGDVADSIIHPHIPVGAAIGKILQRFKTKNISAALTGSEMRRLIKLARVKKTTHNLTVPANSDADLVTVGSENEVRELFSDYIYRGTRNYSGNLIVQLTTHDNLSVDILCHWKVIISPNQIKIEQSDAQSGDFYINRAFGFLHEIKDTDSGYFLTAYDAYQGRVLADFKNNELHAIGQSKNTDLKIMHSENAKTSFLADPSRMVRAFAVCYGPYPDLNTNMPDDMKTMIKELAHQFASMEISTQNYSLLKLFSKGNCQIVFEEMCAIHFIQTILPKISFHLHSGSLSSSQLNEDSTWFTWIKTQLAAIPPAENSQQAYSNLATIYAIFLDYSYQRFDSDPHWLIEKEKLLTAYNRAHPAHLLELLLQRNPAIGKKFKDISSQIDQKTETFRMK